MPARVRTTTRTALVVGAALFAAGGSASAARAASGDITYSCDVSTDPAQPPVFTIQLTERLDFPSIPDDGSLTARVGSELSAPRIDGTMVLPDRVVDLLRDEGVTQLDVGGIVHVNNDLGLDVMRDGIEIPAPLTIPADGPMTVVFRNLGDPMVTDAHKGENLLLSSGPNISLFAVDDARHDYLAGLDCQPVEGADVVIDRFTGIVPATPTVTAEVPTSEPPVRPALVQTDFAGDEDGPGLPLALGGVLALAATGVVLRARVRTRSHPN